MTDSRRTERLLCDDCGGPLDRRPARFLLAGLALCFFGALVSGRHLSLWWFRRSALPRPPPEEDGA